MADAAPSNLIVAINASTDLAWLRSCLEHNRKAGNETVASLTEARIRDVDLAKALKVKAGGDTLEGRVLEALRVYREILKHKHGRNQPAGYTERAIRDHGPKGALLVALKSGKPTDGLKRLAEYHRLDCSYEQIAIDFAAELPADVVEKAKRTLAAMQADR
ncbi:MAG: hypothetical protein JWR10_2443 [Rubritepida sp.]|nr:hypothetical protein [Rubritepida sp.]